VLGAQLPEVGGLMLPVAVVFAVAAGMAFALAEAGLLVVALAPEYAAVEVAAVGPLLGLCLTY